MLYQHWLSLLIIIADDDDDAENELPDVDAPPLKLRLFQAGGEKKQLLCSMFDSSKKSSKH